MISWIVVAAVFIIGMVLLKFKHLNHRLTFLFVLLFFVFIYGTVMIVSRTNELDISTTEGFTNSIKVYFAWLVNGFGNMKDLTGYAIGMNWSEGNVSKIDEKVNQALEK